MFAARPGKPGREPFEPPFLSQGKQGKAPALHTTIGCGFESPKTLTPWRRGELDDHKASLLELDEDDLWVCAEAEGRAPGAGSPGGEHEHFAEAI